MSAGSGCEIQNSVESGKVFAEEVAPPVAQRLIEEYLALAGHDEDAGGRVFRPVTNNRTGELDRPLYPVAWPSLARRRVSTPRRLQAAKTSLIQGASKS